MSGTRPGTPEAIMSAAEMRPLLARSRSEPVFCALGLTESKDAVLLLSRTGSPRKTLADLRKSAKEHHLPLNEGSLCCGTAEVDADADASLVRFKVNRLPPGGTEAKLRATLKGSGYGRAEFVIDAALDAPPDAAAEPAAAAPAAAAAPPSQPDPKATLTAVLGQLAQQIAQAAAGDAGRQQALVRLASAAQAALQQNDLAGAAAQAKALRDALAAPAAAPAGDALGAALGKSGAIWLATRRKIAADIERLRSEIVATYQQDDIGPQLVAAYTARVTPLLEGLDESLAVTLAAASHETDAARRAALVEQAKATMQRYAATLASHSIVADLDRNPFLPLTIEQTVAGTLAVLAKAVH